MARAYCPDRWPDVMTRGELQAAVWPCPTLGQLAALYGPGAPAAWIDLQLTALSLGSRPAGGTEQAARAIAQFAPAFAATALTYKLTELMYFFGAWRAGLYDNSFAAFDTRRIGVAFHQEFAPAHRHVRTAAEERARRPAQACGAPSWHCTRATWLKASSFLTRLRAASPEAARLAAARLLPAGGGWPAPGADGCVTLDLPKAAMQPLFECAARGWVTVVSQQALGPDGRPA